MEALTFGKRADLLLVARERIRRHPDRYVDHIYGEREMGGTSWLYLAGEPLESLDLRTDLGGIPAPEFTSAALGAVPMIVGLWPVVLTGLWAINRRRQVVEERTLKQQVQAAIDRTQAAAAAKAKEAAEIAKKRQESAVEKAVAKAEKETRERVIAEMAESDAGGEPPPEEDER
jgi:hypothetical protein